MAALIWSPAAADASITLDSTAPSTATLPARRVVFIDPQAPEMATLVAGVEPDCALFVLERGREGLAQIAEILSGPTLGELDEISIVAHGAPGRVQLGSGWLDLETVRAEQALLAEIGARLVEDGEVRLYACEVGKGATGFGFIAALSSALGGRFVAASTAPIGGGAPWLLDHATGDLCDMAAPVTAKAQAAYRGVLAVTYSIGNSATWPAPATVYRVVVGDFDGDGDADVLYQTGAGSAFQYGRNEGGVFTLLPQSVSPFSGLTLSSFALGQYRAADLNGDGRDDIFVGSSSSDGTVYISGVDGLYTQIDTTGLPLMTSNAANLLGDFNGDGRVDIIYATGSGNRLASGDGDGTFTPVTATIPFSANSFVQVADFNNDGKADVLVPGVGGGAVHLSNGDGTFQTVGFTGLGDVSPSNRVIVADFDGDGVADVLYQASGTNAAFSFGKGHGDGTFTTVSQDQSPFAGVTIPDFGPFIQRAADFDGDGDIDLWVGAAGAPGTYIMQDGKPPAIVASSPADDAGGVSSSANITITFDESVTKGSGNVSIYRADGTLIETIDVTSPQVSGSGSIWTIDPSVTLQGSTGYYVLADAGTFRDVDGVIFAGIDNPTTLNFTTTAANAAPTISNLNGDVVAFTEGGAAIALDVGGNATVADVDSANFAGGRLTVSIAANGVSAEDLLGVRNDGVGVGQIGLSGGDITCGGVVIGTLSGGTGGADLVVDLSANSTPLSVSALIHALTYLNTNGVNPSTGAREVVVTLSDGDGGTPASQTISVDVSAVNEAPTATNLDQMVRWGANLANVYPQSIVVADADGDAITVTLTLSDPAAGSIVAINASGATGSYNQSTGVLTVNGSVAGVNAMLSNFFYNRAPGWTQDVTITTHVQDSSGAGPADGMIALDFDEAPTISAPASIAVIEDTPSPVTGFVFSDPDASGQMTVAFGTGAGSGTLSAVSADGVTVSTQQGYLILRGSLSDINDFVANGHVLYTTGENQTGPATLGAQFFDDTNPTQFVTQLVDVAVVAVNDAPTFGVPGGAFLDSFDAGPAVGFAALDAGDGKIVGVGLIFNSDGPDSVALARYNADGSLDTSFGEAGHVVTSGFDGQGLGATMQADGKIVVAGLIDADTTPRVAVYRFTADGELDTSFGVGGVADTTAPGLGIIPVGVQVQSDGKIVVAGGDGEDFYVVRLDTDGSLDATFGDGGVTQVDISNFEQASGLVILPGGGILVGGLTNTNGYDFALIKLTAAGVLDSAFGDDGVVVTQVGSGLDASYSITVQPNGQILQAGYAQSSNGVDFALVRYAADGTLDADFGTGGIVTTRVGSGQGQGTSVEVLPDGKILVGGGILRGNSYDFGVVRYNSDGSLDTSFGGGDGIAVVDLGTQQDLPFDMVVQGDGKIVLFGFGLPNGYDFGLARFNADGSLDTTFHQTGLLGGTVDFTEGGAAVVLDADVDIADIELDAGNGGAGDYAGATLTLARQGGADADDAFGFAPSSDFTVDGPNLLANGQVFATVTLAEGTIAITFTSDETPATSALVDAVARAITYANGSQNPLDSVDIDWVFSDGNTGAQGTGGAGQTTGTSTVDITSVNSVPVLSGLNPTLLVNENASNAAPVLIDGDVTFADADFAGGSIVVSGLVAGDRVALSTDGAVSVDSGVVSVGGVQVGTATGGVGGSFTLTLNASATAAVVETLLEHLTYQTTSDTPAAIRNLEITVTDDQGAVATLPGYGTTPDASSPLANIVLPNNGFSAPTFVDLDADGDLDLVSGAFNGQIYAYIRDANGQFAAAPQNPFAGIGVGLASNPSFADIDGDGVLELVVGGNDGQTSVFVRGQDGNYIEAPTNPLGGLGAGNFATTAFADIDGDGRQDFVRGNSTGTIEVFLNGGDGTYAAPAQNPFADIDAGDYSAPTFGDVDGDGDLDLVVGNVQGQIRTYLKGADGSYTEATGAANPFNGIDAGSDAKPFLVDIDGDGDLDLVVGNGGSGGFQTFINNQGPPKIVVGVTAENDAPTITLPATTATATEDANSLIKGVSFADAEAGSGVVTVTLSVAAGELNAFSGGAVTVDGATTTTLTLTGTIADINALIANDGLAFRPAQDVTGPVSIGVSINDGNAGSQGAGGALTTTDTWLVNVTAVNDAPTVTVPASIPVTEDVASAVTGLSFADVDAGSGAVTVTLSVGSGALAATGGAGVTVGGSAGALTLTGSIADINAFIAASKVSFLTAQDSVATVTLGVSINDGGNTGGGAMTGSGSVQIVVTPVNDGPTDVTLSTASVAEAAVNGTVVGALNVADPDAGDTFTYTLVSDAGGRFALGTGVNAGKIVVANGLLLDFEQQSSWQVTVKARDAAGATIEKTLTIAVTDVTPENVTGDGVDNVLVGGSGTDRFLGLGGADSLTGRGGDDTLNGGAGIDTLVGGLGNDRYFVEAAGDVIVEAARSGEDEVFANVSYALASGVSVEHLATFNATGTAAVDLTGNEVSQTLTGNDGANVLDGRGGSDTMTGYAGDDRYVVDSIGDVVVETRAAGRDAVAASVSYVLAAAQEIEVLETTDAAGLRAIELTGNEFAQILTGNAGNNVLNGRGGADTMAGLSGDDRYFMDNANDRVIEAGNGGTDELYANVSYTLAAGQEVEHLGTYTVLGTAAITLTGNEFDQTLDGNAGANTLNGRGGADVMQGFGGDDRYFVDDAGDRVIEGLNGGADTVYANVSYTLAAGQHIETLATFSSTGTAALNLTGNDFANTIIGNAGANILDGLRGADTLTGGAGEDTFQFSRIPTTVDHITDFRAVDDTITLKATAFIGTAGALDASAFKIISGSGNVVDADDRILYDRNTGALFYDADGSGAGLAVQFATLDNKAAISAADFLIY